MAVFDAACRADLRVTSIPNLEREPTLAELADRRIDGLILASVRSPELLTALADAGLPCVEIGSGVSANLIHPDNEGGAALAVAHLVALGHRRIAHFRGPAVSGYYASERRYEGFITACETRKLDPEECPILSTRTEVADALRLPAGKRPTAIFAFNDSQANEVLDVAADAGLRVPEDLSVVGFDNSVVAELTRPRLTTIDNALDAQADAAIALLRTLWNSNTDTVAPMSPVCIPTHLVVRNSTARAPEGV